MDEPLHHEEEIRGGESPHAGPVSPPGWYRGPNRTSPEPPWGRPFPSGAEQTPPPGPSRTRRGVIAVVAAVVAVALSAGALAVGLRSDTPAPARAQPVALQQSGQTAPHSSLTSMIKR